jgi:hypothetical protein
MRGEGEETLGGTRRVHVRRHLCNPDGGPDSGPVDGACDVDD